MATTYQASALRQTACDAAKAAASRRRARVGPLPWIAALALASWAVVAIIAAAVYHIST